MDNSELLTFIIAVSPAIIIGTICGELFRFYVEKKGEKKGIIKSKKNKSIFLFSIITFTATCVISFFIPGKESYLIKVLVMFGIMAICVNIWLWLSYFIRYLNKKS